MPGGDRELCERCRAEVAPQALFCPMCGQPRTAREGDDLIGKVVADRYLLRERLGQGGSGAIYLAEHITVKRKLAVKVYHHELSRDDLAIERFRREATTVAEIDNEHIVEVLDFGRLDDGRMFLAMELLEGETLAVTLKREGQLPLERCLDILTQVGEALMEAHAMGYIHRDLRPGNVFLARRHGKTGFVKILDFGLSKLLQREGEAATTSFGMTFGDPCYMSPEQARGDPVDRRADVYALGVMAYEMLVGRPPFVAKKVFDVLAQHLDARPEPPSRARPEVPAWLDAVVMRALAKKPDDRFVTVYRLIEAVRDGQATGSIMDDEAALSMPAIEPPPPAPRRRDTDQVPPLPAPTRAEAPSASRRVAMAAQSTEPAGASSVWYEAGERPATLSLASMDLVPVRSRRGLWLALGILGGGVAAFAAVVFLTTRGHESAAAGLPDAAVAQATPAPAPTPATVPAPAPAPVKPAEPPPKPVVVEVKPPAPTPEPVARPAPPPKPKPKAQPLPNKVAAAPKPPRPEKPAPVSDANKPPVFDFRPKPADEASEEEADEEEAGAAGEAPALVASETGQADFYVKLGQKSLREGDTDGAAASFNKARAYDTRNADAIAGLGQVAMKRGQYQEAVVHLEAASRLASGSARIHALRGQAYLGTGNREAATAAFKKALSIDPGNKAAAEGMRQVSGQ